jgi:hypothetical protein
MRKTLLATIILSVVLNIIFVGVLVQKTDNSDNDVYVNIPTPKVLVEPVSSSSQTDNPNNSSMPDTTATTNSSFNENTEKLAITNVQANLSAGTLLATVSNGGSSKITITDIFVDYYAAKLENQTVIPANSSIKLLLTFADGIIFRGTYEIKIVTLEGYSTEYFKLIL